MCCRQEELPPTWNAFRFPDFFRNSSSFLSKLSKASCIFTDCNLLAYVTPAPAWCFHLAVFHHEFYVDFVSVDQSNIPRLFLEGIDLRDGYVVMILKPVTLVKY